MKTTIEKQYQDVALQKCAKEYLNITQKYEYSKNISWMGVQAMQYPEDMFALQDILWSTKPDCVIATGVAKGGTLLFISTIMHAYTSLPLIIGIDPFVSKMEEDVMLKHPMGNGIYVLKVSSTDPDSANEVRKLIRLHRKEKIMVILDSMHETEHVMMEINIWHKFVSLSYYLVVGWTAIGESENTLYIKKTWNQSSNPLIAVHSFLEKTTNFVFDDTYLKKYMITTTGKGFLKRIS